MLRAVRTHEQIPQPLGAVPPQIPCLARHASQRGRADRDAVQVLKQPRQAILGQQVPVLQVHRHGLDAQAVVLRPRAHPIRELCPRQVPAGPAQARVRLVLGHFHAWRRRHVEHLPLGVLHAVRLAQWCAAAAAQRRHVLLDVIRVVGSQQSRARVPGPPVAGGRLAAVGTVQG